MEYVSSPLTDGEKGRLQGVKHLSQDAWLLPGGARIWTSVSHSCKCCTEPGTVLGPLLEGELSGPEEKGVWLTAAFTATSSGSVWLSSNPPEAINQQNIFRVVSLANAWESVRWYILAGSMKWRGQTWAQGLPLPFGRLRFWVRELLSQGCVRTFFVSDR